MVPGPRGEGVDFLCQSANPLRYLRLRAIGEGLSFFGKTLDALEEFTVCGDESGPFAQTSPEHVVQLCHLL